jgi:transcription elongation factor GreA
MDRLYLTKAGYDKLAKDLYHFKNVRRKEITEALSNARGFGDLTENAEYESAKESFAMNELRIRELEEQFGRAEILDEKAGIPSDKVYLGARVKLLDLDENEEEEYRIVTSLETDAALGAISTESPVGRALLGHKVGDEVSVQVPRGSLRYRILEISRD